MWDSNWPSKPVLNILIYTLSLERNVEFKTQYYTSELLIFQSLVATRISALLSLFKDEPV